MKRKPYIISQGWLSDKIICKPKKGGFIYEIPKDLYLQLINEGAK